MNIILFDQHWKSLLPLTYTRPVAEIRIGILSIREKWEKWTEKKLSYITQPYLQKKFPLQIEADNLLIAGNVLPEPDLVNEIINLRENEGLFWKGEIVAARLNAENIQNFINLVVADEKISPSNSRVIERFFNHDLISVNKPWNIFEKNGTAIERDLKVLKKNFVSLNLSSSNTLLGDQLYLEEGAKIECSIINTTTGPVYIGKDAEVMEGCMIRGPFALGEGATLKMGAKVYGATTIGPFCKVGGEIGNSVMFGFSNKGHDGFLGNSIIGEWCNLGADTNVSNLKNNYGKVKVWNYKLEKLEDTGLTFHGLVMGDHAKSGINTMFNTGTVVGVAANIFDCGFPPKFIPSFTWGGKEKMEEYKFEKACEAATAMALRRNKAFTKEDQEILEEIFNSSAHLRTFPTAIQ